MTGLNKIEDGWLKTWTPPAPNSFGVLPPLVSQRIVERLGGQWNGKITLNIKDGRILDIEVAEKERV